MDALSWRIGVLALCSWLACLALLLFGWSAGSSVSVGWGMLVLIFAFVLTAIWSVVDTGMLAACIAGILLALCMGPGQ